MGFNVAGVVETRGECRSNGPTKLKMPQGLGNFLCWNENVVYC